MPPIRLKYVVSFSSQDTRWPVTNILEENESSPWLSDPNDRSGQIDAVFQLEKPCRLSFIDIGTTWCANIAIHVGRSSWPMDVPFRTYVPTVNLMSPGDCRTRTAHKKTRMFTTSDFCTEATTQTWDRIRVVCKQPFRKDAQLGLYFLRIRSSRDIDGERSALELPMTLSTSADSTDDTPGTRYHPPSLLFV